MNNYVNGSDLLVSIAGKAAGHCTSHTTTFNTETKDVAVKPAASQAAAAASFFKSKRVTGLSVQVKADGLCFYNEAENGLKASLNKWKLGQSVEVKCFERENDETPYLSGNFIISSLETGTVTYVTSEGRLSLPVRGGFVSVQKNEVNVCVEV